MIRMQHVGLSRSLAVTVKLVSLSLMACGGGVDGGSWREQGEGRQKGG